MWWLQMTESPLYWQQLSAQQGLTAQVRQWLQLTGTHYGALLLCRQQAWLVIAEQPVAQWQLDYFGLCQRFTRLLLLEEQGERTRILSWCWPSQLYVGEISTQQLVSQQADCLKTWLVETPAVAATGAVSLTCVLCDRWRSRLMPLNAQAQLPDDAQVLNSETLLCRSTHASLTRLSTLLWRAKRMDMRVQLKLRRRWLGLLVILASLVTLGAVWYWHGQQAAVSVATQPPTQAMLPALAVSVPRVITAAAELRQLRLLLLQSLAWRQWRLLSVQRLPSANAGWLLRFVATHAAASKPAASELAAVNQGDITVSLAQGELQVAIKPVAPQHLAELERQPLWRIQAQLENLLGQSIRRQEQQLQLPLQQALPDSLAHIAALLDGQALVISTAQLQVSHSQLQGQLVLRRVSKSQQPPVMEVRDGN